MPIKRTKNPASQEYYHLVESYRDKDGKSRHRTLLSLGQAEEVNLEKLAAGINKVLESLEEEHPKFGFRARALDILHMHEDQIEKRLFFSRPGFTQSEGRRCFVLPDYSSPNTKKLFDAISLNLPPKLLCVEQEENVVASNPRSGVTACN